MPGDHAIEKMPERGEVLLAGRDARVFFRSRSRYWPTSRGAICVNSRPRSSMARKNRLTAMKYARRVCSLRMRPKKNSSAAKTAALPARATMPGNWLRRETGGLESAGTRSRAVISYYLPHP